MRFHRVSIKTRYGELEVMVGRKRKTGVNLDWRALHNSDPDEKPSKNWTAVYVIEAGGAVKVGVSRTPVARAKTIQTGQPNRVQVFTSVWMDRHEAYRIENTVHRYLRRKCNVSRGEWFHVSAPYALSVIIEEVKLAGIKGAEIDNPLAIGKSTLDGEIAVA